MRVAAGALALAMGAGVLQPAHARKAQRIVSLNLCTDQILLDLVPRERIAALSFLAADATMSANVEGARGIKTLRGSAEEVLALDPDLVLVGAYSTPATQSLLTRLGVRVLVVPIASSFDEIRSVVRLLASATGEDERGEEIVRTFDARLAAARPADPAQRPTALAYQVQSLASGPGSLMDEMLSTAGFRNQAADRTLGPGGRLPLESLLLSPPDLLVFANAPDDFRTVLGDNLRHPAIAHILESRPALHLPMPLWLCGTPQTVEAVERLAAKRSAILSGEATP